MDFPSLDQDFPFSESVESLISLTDSRLKTADLLFLGRDDAYKRAVISGLSDEDERDAIVYFVNADTERNMEQFSEAREDLNTLLTDEDFENAPFLIICTTADPSALEEELFTLLGLTNMTTGKGRVNLAGRNARPLEVFAAERLSRRHLDAIKWLSQYIK